MRTIKYCMTLALCMILTASFGCNQGPPILPVSGTVTYDGQPVSHAIITFVPNGSGGKPTQAGIMDGKFSIAKKFGVQSGAYMVTVEEAPVEEGMISDVEPEEGVEVPAARTAGRPQRFGFRPYTMNHSFPEGEKKEYSLEIDIPKR